MHVGTLVILGANSPEEAEEKAVKMIGKRCSDSGCIGWDTSLVAKLSVDDFKNLINELIADISKREIHYKDDAEEAEKITKNLKNILKMDNDSLKLFLESAGGTDLATDLDNLNYLIEPDCFSIHINYLRGEPDNESNFVYDTMSKIIKSAYQCNASLKDICDEFLYEESSDILCVDRVEFKNISANNDEITLEVIITINNYTYWDYGYPEKRFLGYLYPKDKNEYEKTPAKEVSFNSGKYEDNKEFWLLPDDKKIEFLSAIFEFIYFEDNGVINIYSELDNNTKSLILDALSSEDIKEKYFLVYNVHI